MFKEKIVNILVKVTKLDKEKLSNLLEVPPSYKMGDYAFPCFIFSDPKNLDDMWKNVEKGFFDRENPNSIAKHFHDIINKKLPKEIERIEVKGPYLNFFVNKEILAHEIIKINHDYGKHKQHKKEKIMMEFAHPNTHKAFHIGHTRNISTGESLSRILEFLGKKVIRVNYQGDIGMHVAKTLWGLKNLKKLGLTKPTKDKGKWLGIVYAKSSDMSKDESINNEIIKLNQDLHNGDKELLKLWKSSRQWSIDYYESVVYPDFDVKFDRFYFESEVEKQGVKIANKLYKKGIAKLSEGAIIMDYEKIGLGIFIILKSDKTPLYQTKDLSLAELQYKEHKPDAIYHVVGSEHKLYFKQLFKTLEYTNKKIADIEHHISYELVILPTGKMKSREGKVILYDDTLEKLIDLANKGITSREQKLSKKEIDRRARIISLGAIKYAMLSNSTNKTIVFNENEIMNFEGNTGPYLQYSYARASSILRKAKKTNNKSQMNLPNFSESEILLINKIANFPEIVKKAGKQMNPALIANYSFELAQIFNEFYHANKVIGNEHEKFRLKLVDSFRTTLKNSLYLLGIEVLEEM